MMKMRLLVSTCIALLLCLETEAVAMNTTCAGGPKVVATLITQQHCRSTHEFAGNIDSYFKCLPAYALHVSGVVSLEDYQYDFSETKPTLPVDICFGDGSACTPGWLSTSFRYIPSEMRVHTEVVLTYYETQKAIFLSANFSTAGLNCTHATPLAPSPTSVLPVSSSEATHRSTPTPSLPATNASKPVVQSMIPSPTRSEKATMDDWATPAMSTTVDPNKGQPNKPLGGSAAKILGFWSIGANLIKAETSVQFIIMALQLCPMLASMGVAILITMA